MPAPIPFVPGDRGRMPATEALKSPATRNLVLQVLTLAGRVDIVDAINDLEHATEVLRERMRIER
jgi:hypothetical protein